MIRPFTIGYRTPDFKVLSHTKAVVILFFLMIAMQVQAAVIPSNTTGNWNTASTWAPVTRTGNITALLISSTVSGSGTLFTTELAVGSILKTSGGTTIGTVASIQSNTSLTLTSNSAVLISLFSGFKAQVVPLATDDATIMPGDVVTVTGNTTINAVVFDNSGSTGGTISVNSGMLLTVTTGITLQNSATANTTGALSGSGTISCVSLSVGNNTAPTTASTTYSHQFTSGITALNISGNLTINSLIGSNNTKIANGSFLFSTGTVTIGGTVVTVNGNAVNNSGFSMATGSQAGTLVVNGNTAFNLSATGTNTMTMNGSSATVNFNGSGTQTIPAFNYTNLTSSNSGARTLASSGSIGVAGAFTIGANSYTVTGSTIDFNGAGAQNIPSFTYNNLTASNANTKSATGTLTVNGTLNIASGVTIDMATNLLNGTLTTISGTGNLKTQNTSATPVPVTKTWSCKLFYNSASPQTIVDGNYQSIDGTGGNRTLSTTGTIAIANIFTPGAGTYTTTSSTVNFNGSGAQTIPAINYYHLTSSGSGGRTLAASGTIGIAGIFTPGTNTYTITGSTIDFNGTGAQTINAFTYNNLSVSGAHGNNNITMSTSANIKLSGSFSNTASFSAGFWVKTGSVVEYNGSGAQTIAPFPYDNLVISGARGTATLTLGTGTIDISGTFSFTATGTISWANSGNTFNYSGSSTQTIVPINYNDLGSSNSGPRILSASGVIGIAGAFTPGTNTYTTTNSTIDYNGTGAQNVTGFTYNNLKVSGGNTKTMAGDATIIDSLKIASSTTLAVDTKAITLKSDLSKTARIAMVDGTVTYGTGGKFIVQRYIPSNRAWRFMTSPLSNTGTIYDNWQNGGVYQAGKGTLVTGPNPSSANGLDVSQQNNISLMRWNNATQSFVNITNTKTNNLSGSNGSVDNQAYFIFVRGDRSPNNTNLSDSNLTTISSAGHIQTGTQNFTAAATAGGYTLIGNPYASPIDFNRISRTNIVKRFYVWDPSLNQVGGYVVLDDLDDDGVYDKSVSSSQDKDIQSGQAFFVQTMIAGSASVSFDESSKSAVNNTSIFRPMDNVKEKISISLYRVNTDGTQKLADGAFAEFNNNYNNTVTIEDPIKFGNTNETLALLRNGTALAAERRKAIDTRDTLFLKLSKTIQTNYQFELVTTGMEYAGVTAFVEDSYLGTTTAVNLSGTTKINFSVTANAASSIASRFRIIFVAQAPLPVVFTWTKAYRENDHIRVKWKVEQQKQVEQYEIQTSLNGREFTTAGTVISKQGEAAVEYSWLDRDATKGYHFYRIKSIGTRGESLYSNIVKVDKLQKLVNLVGIYPVEITNGQVKLKMEGQLPGVYRIMVINAAGQIVTTQSVTHTEGEDIATIFLPGNISTGTYNLSILKPDHTTEVTRLIY